MTETLPGSRPLPSGQFVASTHIRFGLGRFIAKPMPEDPALQVSIGGDVAAPFELGGDLGGMPTVEQRSDFHCVTTWSILDVAWSGIRFADFYHEIVVPRARPAQDATFVVLQGADGYRSALPLADLLASDVILANRINGQPLGVAHGAPLRLVAPAHYGYKSVKHLRAIEFRTSRRGSHFPWPYPGLMDHPRARVAQEERASYLPNWLVRPLYRLFVPRRIR